MTDAAGEHIHKMIRAAGLTGLAMMATPLGVLGLVEVFHQGVAATVDMLKHDSNEKKRNKSAIPPTKT